MGSAIMPLAFTDLDAAASMAAVAMPFLAETGVTEVAMPWDGAIVGISVMSENARTAGTLTVDATIDGTVTGLQAALDATNTQHHYASQTKDSDQFSAGARVGVKVTTDAAWAAGVTPTVAAVVFVQRGKSDT